MKNWSVELTAGEKKLADIPGRCAITITVCNSDDANHSHTWEMHGRLQTY